MPLGPEHRAILEKMIDDQIQDIPSILNHCRMLKLDPLLKDMVESDFVFGYIWKSVLASFTSYLSGFRLEPDGQVAGEAINVLINRLPQIRQAILSCRSGH